MNKKILIVEDEFVVANSLRLVLVQAGYYVSGIAASAEEADEFLLEDKPDLVLLDIRLRGKRSGIDLAKKLRNEGIGFVYLSANSNQKVLEEAKATEPYGFLVKPYREKDLLITLDIAWYRLKHSLETRLSQEQSLQDQLLKIPYYAFTAEHKLLNIARVIQPFIPFDLILSVSRSNMGKFESSGCVRTGYSEYQHVSEKEVSHITGLQGDALSLFIENNEKNNDPFILSDETIDQARVGKAHKYLLEYFKIQSFLAVSWSLNGLQVDHFFYSRQRNVYTQSHIALLNRLKVYLTVVAEKTANVDPLSNSPAKWTNSAEKITRADAGNPGFDNIIGNHPLLLAALDLTVQVAPYTTSVLVLGESGTGKEKIAQLIHSLSPRNSKPFIKLNCAAIPAALIESELFGHEKGAFTGAHDKRTGKFELANGGTIFLDEIGELSLDMQIKLLRVLQEKEIEPLGAQHSKKIDVRIVAATNRNLEKEVGAGNFRLDLYYRLNVFPITLPPLRDRKSDIPALAEFFARKFCKDFNKEFTGISDGMLGEMYTYNWPGNIRELENVLERSVILNNGKCCLELKQSLTTTATEVDGKINISTLGDVRVIQQETEKEYIISVLKKTDGRIRGANGAAELLDIKPTTLEARMIKLGIRKEHFSGPSQY